jgi:hypothetical protein
MALGGNGSHRVMPDVAAGPVESQAAIRSQASAQDWQALAQS